MKLVKIQRRARNRMKASTSMLAEDDIGVARFVATYYSNFALGLGVALLGYKRESGE